MFSFIFRKYSAAAYIRGAGLSTHVLFLAHEDANELLTRARARLRVRSYVRERRPWIYVVPLEALSIAIANYKQRHLGRILIICSNKVPSAAVETWGNVTWEGKFDGLRKLQAAVRKSNRPKFIYHRLPTKTSQKGSLLLFWKSWFRDCGIALVSCLLFRIILCEQNDNFRFYFV